MDVFNRNPSLLENNDDFKKGWDIAKQLSNQ